MEIVRGPLTVPNATIGGTVSFECILSIDAIPRWNINGNDYIVTHLPPQFNYMSNSNTHVLIVGPVHEGMNNTCIFCYLQLLYGRRESSVAKLIIKSRIPSYSTSWQTSTAYVTAAMSTAFPSLLPSGLRRSTPASAATPLSLYPSNATIVIPTSYNNHIIPICCSYFTTENVTRNVNNHQNNYLLSKSR